MALPGQEKPVENEHMRKVFIGVVVIFAVGAAWVAHRPLAANGLVALNEIMYDFPGSDGPHEWIEIWNTGDVAQDLTAWKFFDGTNHALNAPPANDGQGSLILNPETYAIFADSAATFLTDHPGFSGIVIDTVMSLNNTGATLKLLDTNGMVVSQLTYANSNGARGNGKTLEVKVDGSLAPSNTIGGTLGAQNSP